MATSTSSIAHVFVLMLENRSFDHLFGLSGITGVDASNGSPTRIDGLNGQTNEYGGTSYPVGSPAVDPMSTDPGHEFLDTLEQLCGAGTANPFPVGPYPAIDCSGFVANYATTTTEGPVPGTSHFGDVMRASDTATETPALYTLATEFAICDRWFSSMPGPTWPNRLFAMGASSAGLDDSPSSLDIGKWESFSGFRYPNGSIFDLMRYRGVGYKLYADKANRFASHPSSRLGSVPIVSALKNIQIGDVADIGSLASDLHGDYPYAFTWIEPNYGDVFGNSYTGGSSQHPMDSLAAGDAMVAAVYEAIRNSPLWESSMLVVTYDEHGGFYDHVAPPAGVRPDDYHGSGLNKHGFDFTQLGVRVPAVVASPLIPQHTIDHAVYDHSSILRTAQVLSGLPSLTDRDRHANDFVHLASLASPRTDCPTSLDAAAPTSAAPTAADDDHEALPMSGNTPGFLMTTFKNDLDLRRVMGAEIDPSVAAERVQDITTRGAARDYLHEVSSRALEVSGA